jgi:hypothetical protein
MIAAVTAAEAGCRRHVYSNIENMVLWGRIPAWIQRYSSIFEE